MRWLFPCLLFAVPACAAVLGIEEVPTPPPEPAECAACAQTSCGSQREACLADPACHQAYACVAGCALDDIACRLHCEQAHDAASHAALYGALDECRRKDCTEECYGKGGFSRLVDAQCSCVDDVCKDFVRNCIVSKPTKTDGSRVGDCERRFACLADRKQPIDPEDALMCNLSQPGRSAEGDALRFCWQGAECGSCPLAGGKMTACLGAYQWSRPIPNDVNFTMHVTDQRGHGIPAAKVRACRAEDCASCARPAAEDVTSSEGDVTLQLSTFGSGFFGCFEIVATGYTPTLWYAGRPIITDEALLTVPLLPPEELAGYGTALGATVDPAQGQLLFATRDCLFSPASGLTLEADAGPSSFTAYLLSGTPSRTGPTDATGRGAIVNAAPGTRTVIARHGADEHGRIIAEVRAGWMTGVFIFPKTGS